jgi:hypothetical protein
LIAINSLDSISVKSATTQTQLAVPPRPLSPPPPPLSQETMNTRLSTEIIQQIKISFAKGRRRSLKAQILLRIWTAVRSKTMLVASSPVGHLLGAFGLGHLDVVESQDLGIGRLQDIQVVVHHSLAPLGPDKMRGCQDTGIDINFKIDPDLL